MSDQTYPELQSLEIQKLRKKIIDLEIELKKYKNILEENDLLDEISSINVNTTEVICVAEIKKLAEISEKGVGLTLEDVKILDILHKNLLLARGEIKPEKDKKGKQKQATVTELLSIVNGEKK